MSCLFYRMRKPMRTRNLGPSDIYLANQDHLRLPGDTSTHGVTQTHVSCALTGSLQQSILAIEPFWFGGSIQSWGLCVQEALASHLKKT